MSQKLPVTELDKWGFPKETFLQLEPDGRVTVKDGRSLEEFLNDPRLTKKRRKWMGKRNQEKPEPMMCVSLQGYLYGLMPRCG